MQTIGYFLLGISMLSWAEVLLAESALASAILGASASLLPQSKPKPKWGPEPEPGDNTRRQDKTQLFLGKYPVKNENRNSPIVIDTEKVIDPDCPYPPLVMYGSKAESGTLWNTGKSVKVVNKNPNTTCYVKGGVYPDDTFALKETKFFWNIKKNDEESYVLAEGTFFNIKYRTFETALKYSDGLITIEFKIRICSTPNSEFPPMAEAVVKVQIAGAKWWAYPGAYKDEGTGKTYYCNTYYVVNNKGACISKPQLEQSFASVKNSSGDHYPNTPKMYSCKQPVVCGREVKQMIHYPFWL